MLEHLSIYTFIFFIFWGGSIFHLDVHYVCVLVQRFEPQGRCFTNFHYYYYILGVHQLTDWPSLAYSPRQCEIRVLSASHAHNLCA